MLETTLDKNRSELVIFNQQVEEVAARVEGVVEDITSELGEILGRLSELVSTLGGTASATQAEVSVLMQAAQQQTEQIRQQEIATLIRGTKLQVHVSEALREMGELQRELDTRLSELGQSLSEGQQSFIESLNILLGETQEKLIQLAEITDAEVEALGSELNGSMLIGTNQSLVASFRNFLEKEAEFLQVGQETFREVDFELGSTLGKFADSIESLKLISGVLGS